MTLCRRSYKSRKNAFERSEKTLEENNNNVLEDLEAVHEQLEVDSVHEVDEDSSDEIRSHVQEVKTEPSSCTTEEKSSDLSELPATSVENEGEGSKAQDSRIQEEITSLTTEHSRQNSVLESDMPSSGTLIKEEVISSLTVEPLRQNSDSERKMPSSGTLMKEEVISSLTAELRDIILM
ncbi:hypothetical protein OS493_008867 [Desmophyllum pertusum]|uniref:Uncharacterized protein n=1 Tax=Desmophyllum pertusum TaxID=174260 RepID=A0A9W9ZFK1_9CNID|nr:hypothetical protein OS493_008867 [Desmophyllum pertusum]